MPGSAARLSHLVSAAAVLEEEQRIRSALTAGGYDAAKLDLDGVAKQALVRDLIAGLEAVGAHIVGTAYGDHPGGLEVVIECDKDASLIVAKAALEG